ncbi:unnamed protein product [Zymoseptoria tritici ST99CH_3D7]|uniref:Aquaporin n=3 Tax=Zymoseptoria tritici TaxID=1047171 RepID=A0A1X7RRF1_ZYMT9|nr:unnamed protein product [Zymoseptoria tritici ST99CH_3D7]SMR51006.1 unnamed protein product [Zymoseptoria tritici ST99CH_1E4]
MQAPPSTNPTLTSQYPMRTIPSDDATTLGHGGLGATEAHPSAPYSPTLGGDRTMSNLKGGDSPTDDSEYDEERLAQAGLAPPVTQKLKGPRKWMGLQPVAPLQSHEKHAHHNHLAWSKVKITFKEPMAEFWGTFILVLFGDAGLAQVTLGSKNPGSAPGGMGFGDWQSVSWAYGIGLMLGVYVAGDSGAYLNPCITFASCILRGIPWRRLPMYIISQTLGAFCAAGVIYGNYYSLIDDYEGGPGIRTVGGPTSTAGIFATYPADGVSTANLFFDQFIASALLVFIIFALKDDSNKGSFIASGAWFPLALFFLMFGISATFGLQTGFAINFARDMGPRLMTWALGYGNAVWTTGNYYFWIPTTAPFLGCLTGGIIYDACIYTGPSPINTPWFGLKKLFNPKRAVQERLESQKDAGAI